MYTTKVNPQFEKVNYENAFATRHYALQHDNVRRETVNEFKARSSGLTLKEALTSDELSGFIPDVFTDELVALGLREAWARNTFPVVPQSSNSDFKHRFTSRSDGAQILGELDEIKHTGMERQTETYTFVKIADWPFSSFELLLDSPLNESALQMMHAASKIYRRENQLMTHMLTTFSEGANATAWSNHTSMTVGTSVAPLLEAMETAYLNMTSRLVDRADPSSLRWYFSPTAYALLWTDETVRRFDILGAQPSQITGSLPAPFGIPYTIIENGYFAQGTPSSVFTATDLDVFLVAQNAAAIRERVSLRIEPITEERFQGAGPILWERLTPYIRNPRMYTRISATADYTDLIATEDIRIKPQIEAD